MSDFIKRQDAIDAIVRCSMFTREQLEEIVSKSGLAHYEEGLVDAIHAVEDTPSAERTAKVKHNGDYFYCSECEEGIALTQLGKDCYCSGCGAKLDWSGNE